MTEYLKDLGTEILVGKFIKDAFINDDKDLVVLDTDQGKLYLTWEGDCCAICYLENMSGVENLIGAKILSVEHMQWKDITQDLNNYIVLESMGTRIKTDKGCVEFETRLDHNGFYAGYIKVSDKSPLSQYNSPRYENYEFPTLKKLEDF